MTNRGQFIVIYGPNNLGKSEQAKRLGLRLAKEFSCEPWKVGVLKYPIYELEPTGPIINSVIRGGVKMDELELQKIYAQNRRDFEPELIERLEQGTFAVAEDYKGTGIAWGMNRGLSLELLEEMNAGQLEPDLSILLDGEKRYSGSIERGHRYEDAGDKDWQNAREAHLFLAQRYDWEVVNANETENVVEQNIWNIVSSKYNF